MTASDRPGTESRRPQAKEPGGTGFPETAAPSPVTYLVTCEHGGNRVPPRYRALFAGKEDLLQTHRGQDPGALAMARRLAGALGADLVASTTTRLLIDLNRSIGHPGLFSALTRRTPKDLREEILARHYRPYREQAATLVAEALAQGRRVIHISSHSFTPILDGKVRKADIGLLYDHTREAEAELCTRWLLALKRRAPELAVRRNYPYTGRSDGFCAWFRRHYPGDRYLGIELEMNQKHVAGDAAAWRRLRETVVTALVEALHGATPDRTAPRPSKERRADTV